MSAVQPSDSDTADELKSVTAEAQMSTREVAWRTRYKELEACFEKLRQQKFALERRSPLQCLLQWFSS